MDPKNWLRGLTSLFFPTVCLSCQSPIARAEELLCVGCDAQLPMNDHWKNPDNAVSDRLAGRLPLRFAAAAYTFRDDTVCQRLIHALKYHHRPDVGRQLGQRFGEVIARSPQFADLSGIVPVPIHERRRHERGYNQAEAIAEGLGLALKVPVLSQALRRRSFTGSQTRKSKLERLENVRHSFIVGKGDFRDDHLLLVDDVLTTGATLDFCGNVLLEAHPGLRISVATLALAEL